SSLYPLLRVYRVLPNGGNSRKVNWQSSGPFLLSKATRFDKERVIQVAGSFLSTRSLSCHHAAYR
ncbi:MAG: hypothetical protein ACOVS5_11560, partial [Oligoflexus sp.]